MVALYSLNEEIDQKRVKEEECLGIRRVEQQLLPLSTFYERGTFSTILEVPC